MGVRQEARQIAIERIRRELVGNSITNPRDPVVNAQLRNLSKDAADLEQMGGEKIEEKSGEIFCANDATLPPQLRSRKSKK